VQQLQSIHLRPYTNLITGNDFDLVMSAHVWYSAVDIEGPWPATLSSRFNRDILRGQLGYDGLLFSDAYDMAGLTVAVPSAAERGVVGIESGLDVILGPSNSQVGAIWQGMVDAVRSGRLTEERIDESVRRVLLAKSRAHLPEERTVDPALWPTVLDHPEHRATVRTVCERACTRVFDRTGEGPFIGPDDDVLVIFLAASQRIFYRFGTETFQTRFAALHPQIESDGEMHGDAALSEEVRLAYLPDSRLSGSANLLVMPNLDAANVLFNVIKTTGGKGITVGPILLGAARPVHIMTPSATVRRILNMTALAVAQASLR
jgi:beta-glucosidase-like glycosyl hydrolase